ncbi:MULTISPECIES: polysaccharide biosynthesis tyrosine autokinase [Variovorax]|jgi:tyrosine-protein kinase Etk/Wzc|uniref:polysaccharide biosynthesis tyrosine autokinase n=1 Tax=Variovorax TaxID=34072 RepID=UPI00089AD79C|nr:MULTISPECIES: polysaccharide biosynthesis tyrosine autokinase [Variovorax]MDQ0083743.1 tyrosine-protein kinase Etk/Wzc [Variovorax boronicumulans]SDX24323.1 tyrosine-protein kinase Etk/Wzc [Variovorax sp. YR634]SDZ26164.1 tyrosine-protein kinase Etk/Wzc [Variovorax sp. YR266]
MNAPPQAAPMPMQALEEDGDGINLAEYLDILIDHRWLVAAIVAVTVLLGAAYAFLGKPLYEANVAVQVEDSGNSAGSFLGDAASSLLSVKTPAAGEIEILRSRAILGKAVENTKLYISARPRYAPIVGSWLARRATELSDPGFMGLSGYVTGTESILVPRFDVPADFEEKPFTLTLGADGQYELSNPDIDTPMKGSIGTLLVANVPGVPNGSVSLLVSSINAKPGAQFQLVRSSTQLTLLALQDNLKVVEKGKQSGVLDVSWRSGDAEKLTQLLNEIGRLYVRQNMERKAAEAEKTLGFLDGALPQFKKQLEQSEDIYNRYRNQNGTVSLDDEAKNALTQTIDLQSKLLEAEQKRRELTARFTSEHPAVQTLDTQVAAWKSALATVDARIRKMPELQQNTVRMQRDIKVNTDLYVSLLNSSLQMRLAKEGKVGNVRLLDDAIVPEEPVWPKRPLVIALAVILGLAAGIGAAIARNSFFGGIRNPGEIESHTGLNVYSSIPLSAAQRTVERNIENKVVGKHVLAHLFPEDPAVESLRSLRTALQFAMLEATNNRLLISGATPGVGKTFISVNFAAITAATGKKVLLIDADLRKGRVNQFLSIQRSSGLSELIAGTLDLEKAIRPSALPNLDIITTGVLPPNPAELLTSDSFAQVLEKLSPLYDLVIIDTAPVLVAADTASVAPLASTLLLVARAEKTQLGELNESVRRLAHAGRTVNGVILNAIDLTRRHAGSGSYKYGAYKHLQYTYNTNRDST